MTQVKAGFKFGLALLSNCTVESWGTANKGQLGNGGQLLESHPVPVKGLTEVKEIAVANAHAMALRYDGTVWTWGASEFGERGNKERGFERTARQTESWFVPRDEPTEVPGLTGVKQIVAGGKRDFALLSDGEVMAWGEDRNGDLGVEEKGAEEELCYGEAHAITPAQCSTIPRPVKIKNLGKLAGVERIGAGEETAYAIGSQGKKVAAWGAGGKGQLGDGETEDSSSPVRTLLEPGSPVVEIVGGAQPRAGQAGQRRTVRLGIRRLRPARLRNRLGTRRNVRSLRVHHGARTGPLTRARGGPRRRRRDQLRGRGRRKRGQGAVRRSAAAGPSNCSASGTSTSRARRRPPRSPASVRSTPSRRAPPRPWRSSKAAPATLPPLTVSRPPKRP